MGSPISEMAQALEHSRKSPSIIDIRASAEPEETEKVSKPETENKQELESKPENHKEEKEILTVAEEKVLPVKKDEDADEGFADTSLPESRNPEKDVGGRRFRSISPNQPHPC